jgi:hypothetical protein
LAQCYDRGESNAKGESVMEWQPIETAPKDGTPILVWRKAGIVWLAYWNDSFLHVQSDQHMPAWVVFDCEDPWFSETYQSPTHWQPLPEPPKP